MLNIKHEENIGQNSNNGIFTLYENGLKAGEMTYFWETGNRININHTQVDTQFAGKHYGKKLVLAGIDFARQRGLTITASCWYAEKILLSKAK
ncbi:MAG: GNAT family N-acetyltransferase [Parahaliea sp.]